MNDVELEWSVHRRVWSALVWGDEKKSNASNYRRGAYGWGNCVRHPTWRPGVLIRLYVRPSPRRAHTPLLLVRLFVRDSISLFPGHLVRWIHTTLSRWKTPVICQPPLFEINRHDQLRKTNTYPMQWFYINIHELLTQTTIDTTFSTESKLSQMPC